MGVLVDSSVLIGAERRGLSLSSIFEDFTDDLAVSAVTLSELLFGLHRAQTEGQRQNRQQFIDTILTALPVLPIDQTVAEIHARIWSDLTSKGQAIGTHDFFIAATALAYGYAVLTDNVGEFARIPGLEVRQPPWAR